MIRALMVEDHPIVQRGIRAVLEENHEIEIEGVSSGEEALDKLKTVSPDIVLLDISLPGIDGIEVLRQIKKISPSLPVLMLSMHSEEEYAVKAMADGASGYVTKKSIPDELLQAIEKVLSGKRYVSTAVADLMVSALSKKASKSPIEDLSEREYKVMVLIAAGKKLTEIGREMSISEKTVSTYRSRMLKKMNMKNNAELVKFLAENAPQVLPPKPLQKKPA